MIGGWYNQIKQPFISAAIVLPRLGWRRTISLLADTGCGGTTLHPKDCVGLPYDRLANEASTLGVGGRSRGFKESAWIVFNGQPPIRMAAYQCEILIAEPTEHNERLPSLLGQDILQHWKITYDWREKLVLAEVHWADYILPR